jgi:hypothetical protein
MHPAKSAEMRSASAEVHSTSTKMHSTSTEVAASETSKASCLRIRCDGKGHRRCKQDSTDLRLMM